MENIMNKESKLAVIQQQAEKAEIEKKALEEQSNKMLDEKQHIESDIKQLIQDKFLMEKHIEEQENEVVKTKFLLAPLAEKVSGLETELNTLTTQITNKQEELKNLKMKIVESGSSASENEKSSVSMLAPVLGLSLLFNLIVIISLILAFTGSQRQDNDN